MPSEVHEMVAALDRQAVRISTPADGGEIVWRMWGEGPALVLFHGGHGSWTHWIRNIPYLSRTYRVVVPDLPGMGDSTAVGGGTDLGPMADALASGIDRLPIEDRYFLGGFSFGSLVAGHVLARHGERIRHLLLVGSSALGPFERVGHRLRRWRDVDDPVSRLEAHRHNLSVLMLHDLAEDDALALSVQARNAEKTRVNYAAAVVDNVDLPGLLDRFPVPTTGLWGEREALVRNHMAEHRDVLARLRRPGRSFVVPGVGHWVQYEGASAANELTVRALRDTD